MKPDILAPEASRAARTALFAEGLLMHGVVIIGEVPLVAAEDVEEAEAEEVCEKPAVLVTIIVD